MQINKIILQGSYSRKKQNNIYKELKNFDIKESKIGNSTVDYKTFLINHITISKKENSNDFYMYHMYSEIKNNKIEYTGRWYDLYLSKNKMNLDDKDMSINYVIPEYELELENLKIEVIKYVNVKIFFSNSGWKKLLNFLQ
jgi:hypothetical protein